MDYNIVFMTLMGLSFGSFLNVLIYRIPKKQSIVFPSSSCTNCNKKLKIYHNIPVLSYLFLRGKCGFCGVKISPVYPFIEVLSAAIFVIVYLIEVSFLYTFIISGVFLLFLGLSVIDFRYKAVPDSLNLFALSLAIVSSPYLLDSLSYALLFVGGFSLLRFYVSYFKGCEAMGEADIIIAGSIGALLGIELGLAVIVLSAFIALPIFILMRVKDYELPYVPFLAFATFIVYIFQSWFQNLIIYLYY